MTEIRPFRAVHYDQDKVGNLSKVVCPPYDVISPQQQNGYYTQSEHNFIRLVLNKEQESDDKSNNRYSRAKQLFDQWQSQGVLVEDAEPSIYYYKQEYKIQGTRHSRLGFIALMKIQDSKNSKIYPHENTHSRAKEDRLKLIKAVNSNLSPIFVCFSDKTKKVEKIFNEVVAPSDPLFDIVDDQDIRHIVWRLTDSKRLKEIVEALDNQPLFIADGHHRYEVAKEYRRFKLDRQDKSSGREPFNYVMTYFTNMDISRNLTIFPIHRVITRMTGELDFLEEYFRIDKIRSHSDLQIMVAKAGLNEPSFGLYRRGSMQLLRLKNKLLIDKMIKEGSREFRRLDATILKYFILERVGVKSEDIIYTNDFQEATGQVDEGRAEACFIMNSVPIKQIRDIALNGERMPPKTTFFYPKLLSGLAVHKMG